MQPTWPSLTVVCRLATTTYRRLKATGVWDGIVDKKKNQAYTNSGTPHTGRPEKPPGGCLNCGSPNHWLDQCPQPKDQARIDANRKKYFETHPRARGSRGGGRRRRNGNSNSNSGNTAQANTVTNTVTTPTNTSSLPKHISAENGVPLILNKQGNYVIDQKRYTNFINQAVAALGGGTPAPKPPQAAPTPRTASANVSVTDNSQKHVKFSDEQVAQAAKIRSAFKNSNPYSGAGTLLTD